MVMPGAGAQRQGDCWGLREGWGISPVNGYNILEEVFGDVPCKIRKGEFSQNNASKEISSPVLRMNNVCNGANCPTLAGTINK